MQARNPEVGLQPRLDATRLDDHAGLVGHRDVRGAGGEDACFRRHRLGCESLSDHARRAVVSDQGHACARRGIAQR